MRHDINDACCSSARLITTVACATVAIVRETLVSLSLGRLESFERNLLRLVWLGLVQVGPGSKPVSSP